ncbi:SGNH/GDSL hydrolase family protein [Lutimonas sp.]|uniref:SGNH/GDSL hydrolase family protein n=1 Tax=Lutimonas sp. TaxID=1872403 RepID=UPI003D9AB854
MHVLRPHLTIVCVLILFNTCLKAQQTEFTNQYKLLFVGNSLSYSNNLPQLVVAEGEKRQLELSAEILAKPNYALIDHLKEGELAAKIKKGSFDFVIVQQGPSSQQEGRDLLFKAVEKLDKICKKNQSQLSVFMVWPSQQYYHTFDKVIKNHRDVAEKYQAVLCPVGEIWKAHFDKTQDYSYYGSDGFHPSKKGSQAAAAIIVDSLFDM